MILWRKHSLKSVNILSKFKSEGSKLLLNKREKNFPNQRPLGGKKISVLGEGQPLKCIYYSCILLIDRHVPMLNRELHLSYSIHFNVNFIQRYNHLKYPELHLNKYLAFLCQMDI